MLLTSHAGRDLADFGLLAILCDDFDISEKGHPNH